MVSMIGLSKIVDERCGVVAMAASTDWNLDKASYYSCDGFSDGFLRGFIN